MIGFQRFITTALWGFAADQNQFQRLFVCVNSDSTDLRVLLGVLAERFNAFVCFNSDSTDLRERRSAT